MLGGGSLARIRAVWEASQRGEAETEPTAQVELPAEFQQDLDGMVRALADDLTILARRIYARATEIAKNRVREALKGADHPGSF